ncbi:hypothetical protein LINGRAPRIM_LOCUS2942 [Linum grandiflorum]
MEEAADSGVGGVLETAGVGSRPGQVSA